MPTDADLIRRDIVAVCQRLYQRGFIAGTEGNVSVLEAPDRLWITPSGHHKGLLQPADQGRVVPHRSYVKGWKISPSHMVNQDLTTVWLDK